jgi:hypothetical protein
MLPIMCIHVICLAVISCHLLKFFAATLLGWVSGFRGATDTVAKMAKRSEYSLRYMKNRSL